jgi:hypothetical protein
MGKQGAESRLLCSAAQVVDVILVSRPVVHMWQRSTQEASVDADYPVATHAAAQGPESTLAQ